MIDSKFRNPYQKWIIAPLLKWPFLTRRSPMGLTLLGLLFGLLVPLLLFKGESLLALCSLAASGFFDTLDGSIARFQETTSQTGAALDITVDRIVEFCLVLGLYLYLPETRALLCLLMLGSILFCITTFLVVGIFTQNTSAKSFHYSPGLIERAEAFLFFGLMILFPQWFHFLALLFTLLVTLTGCVRIGQFLYHSSEKKLAFGERFLCRKKDGERS